MNIFIRAIVKYFHSVKDGFSTPLGCRLVNGKFQLSPHEIFYQRTHKHSLFVCCHSRTVCLRTKRSRQCKLQYYSLYVQRMHVTCVN